MKKKLDSLLNLTLLSIEAGALYDAYMVDVAVSFDGTDADEWFEDALEESIDPVFGEPLQCRALRSGVLCVDYKLICPDAMSGMNCEIDALGAQEVFERVPAEQFVAPDEQGQTFVTLACSYSCWQTYDGEWESDWEIEGTFNWNTGEVDEL